MRGATVSSYVLGMTSVLAKNKVRFVALLFTVCASLAGAALTSTPASAAYAQPTGTVNVAYAASLTFLNEKVVSPAFTAADGYKFSGFGMASGAIEADIAAGEIHPNVFESVGGDNITPLENKFTQWYIQYAGTSMVIAYNPHSRYASKFKAYAAGKLPLSGLFKLLETPGLRLGRTDPNIDPQGRDFIEMLELAQAYYHLPSNTVAKILGTTNYGTANSSEIFAESALDSDSAVWPAGRGQCVRHPGDRTALGLHQAADPDQPGRLLGRGALPHGVGEDRGRRGQARVAAGHRHHDHRQADCGRNRVRQVYAVGCRSGRVQEWRLHHPDPDADRSRDRGAIADLECTGHLAPPLPPAALSGGIPLLPDDADRRGSSGSGGPRSGSARHRR